ncbi:MAG: SAM-dependent methyltransferase [Rhodovulum sulfidophilum]|uniref:SAM-dependent methyltransferase n=1 Tax=Rhodovulum sulfidophilum TaxID=35806 RepID=A0A2W5NFS5_RHOSU|nr:MAG: SAM-dependent methyltransferase [Rhodovulum sulfidophilum]
MRDSDKLFAGSIPALYDRLMVPLIFRSYAEDLAVRAAAGAPDSVLEIAAGTGALPRALAPLLGPDCRYVVTDLNAPMLDYARGRQPADPRIDWRPADALALPFEDGGFDRVLCQFGVMFFPDRVAGYREALRVLRPGGRFLFNSWDRIEANDFADRVTRAAAVVFPADPPRFFARTPHGYHDPDRIRSDLAAAGFTQVTITPLEATGTATSATEVATAFCQGTPLRAELEARGGALDAVTAEVARALEAEFGAGPVTGRSRALVVTAGA